MATWLVKRKQERERAEALRVREQLKAMEAAAEEAAKSMKKLTGPLADLGEATRKFGEKGSMDKSAITAQKIKITDEHLAVLSDPNIAQKLRNYFMEAYRLKKVTTWGISRDDQTMETVISWRARRSDSMKVIEDVRQMLLMDDPPVREPMRWSNFTVAYTAIESAGKGVADFMTMLSALLRAWKADTGIPEVWSFHEQDNRDILTIAVGTTQSNAKITDARFENEIKELIAKAMFN